ncbi:MAG TPA: rhomboid family intramembrane serine protease [Phycisphaerales bacterium]
MGLAERQYQSSERDHSWSGSDTGGPGSWANFRGWSVNTWLIVVNCVVFVLGATLLAGPGIPVLETRRVPVGITNVELDTFYLPDRGPASRADQIRVGQSLRREVVNRQTRELVDLAEYRVRPPLDALGHFSTQKAFLEMQVWRFVTFQFLHADVLHIFFNMFGLYIFGGVVERYLGSRRYLAYYLVTGIFGGLLYLVLNLLGYLALRSGMPPIPGLLFHQTTVPLVGASAGVFGVIMACAKIEPNSIVQLIFPPVSLRMKTLAYGFVGLALINLLFTGKNAGGEAAHIGGAIAGYYFIRNSHLLADFFDVFSDSRKLPKPGKRRSGWSWLRSASPTAPSAEVDRILAKVRASGIASLTEQEKKILADDTNRLRARGG